VTVASEVGKGSTFTLYLPRVPGADRPQRLRSDESQSLDGDGMSVLVVEDNIEVGRFVADALSELGYATTLVDNAMDALAELSRNAGRFDVVFSDMMMPEMTGLDLAQEIRRRQFDVPIVLTSGDSHMLSQSSAYGFALLQKPYSSEQLSRILQKVGRGKRISDSAAE
jgi:two-component system NtrC family sensor kinase